MIYVALPAYNEEDSIKDVFENIFDVMNKLKTDYKVIICNDGSTDSTLKKINEYKNPNVIVLNHKINRGLGETIRDIFEKFHEIGKSDDLIIRLDCDNTHNPSLIINLIEKINLGYDVVIASRYVKGGGEIGLNSYRKLISKCANTFMKVFFYIKGLKEYSSGYRIYKYDIIDKALRKYGNHFIQLKSFGFACTLEKLVKLKLLNAKISEVPFVLRYDKKKSDSKMIASITTLGYIVMVILYYWPFGGWYFSSYKSKKNT